MKVSNAGLQSKISLVGNWGKSDCLYQNVFNSSSSDCETWNRGEERTMEELRLSIPHLRWLVGFPEDCNEHRSLKSSKNVSVCHFLLNLFFLPLSEYRSQKIQTSSSSMLNVNSRELQNFKGSEMDTEIKLQS